MIKTMKKLLTYARPWRGTLILTVTVLVIGALMNLVTPAVAREITARLSDIGATSLREIIFLALLLGGAYVVRGVCRFLALWQAHVAAWNYVPALTLKAYDHIQCLTPKWYGNHQTGDIMSRVLNDTRELEVLIAHALPDLISNVIIILGVIVMVFTINPMLAAIALIPVPFVIYASTFYSKKVAPLYKKNRKFFGSLNGSMQEQISGIKEIQAFSATEREHVRMDAMRKTYTMLNVRANFANGIYNPLIELLTSLGTVLVTGIGGALALKGSLSAADLVGFFMYLTLFYTPLTSLARLAEDVQNTVAAGERVLQLLDEKPDIKEKENAIKAKLGEGKLEFEKVGFTYDEGAEPVLSDVSFVAMPGTMTAIVGATGAGKTTITSLIERFYDTTSGRILLDGVDIRELTLDSLRQNLSLVLQDVFLFNGTILDNIRYGYPKATIEDIEAASKAAHVDDFVRDLPDGYDTVVGERGIKLSGGQKQRIAIARAILRPSPILILDEATSAVDNKTESLIQESMDELCGKKTLIVIAHRLSTIRKADNIIVLENGRISQSGTNDELMKAEGLYRQLKAAQDNIVAQ